MNNEPVAWMLNGILHECDPSDWAKEQYPDQDVISLYTHPADESFDRTASHMAGEYVSYPAKTLTDEEIQEAYVEHCKTEPSGKGNLIDFARAILRKAQEK